MAAAGKPSNSSTPARAGKNRSRVQARHAAREKALQALYQRELGGGYLIDIERQFLQTQPMEKVDIEYFLVLLHGVPANLEKLDEVIVSVAAGRSIDDLDPIERTICRLGAWELQERHDIPVKVVINESVELARKFGADQGHKFVNGVMDKLAAKLRSMEFQIASSR